MLFADDTSEALRAAVELANSALEPDTMTTVDDLVAFYEGYGYTGTLTGDEAELAAVREIRPALRTLLSSPRDEAVAHVNAMLRENAALPQLVRHGSTDWHLHAVDDDRPLATRILVETAMAMIDVVRADETSRLGVCADDTCEGLVLDLSRNRSRRFCSTACSNRNAVAAYRARRAEDER
ncbi:CGNR zinc finger domain-containing protein [Aeromicrobium massiliense]|uniref:CGNR zinc finger domain-containing protein n=1 Tax=Aeromicrobium massiliense TaxID=1464554 RepID=UPI000317E3CE|nr:CGNR zinc finger domain-containing protein [Aeromicrobium massiliense]